MSINIFAQAPYKSSFSSCEDRPIEKQKNRFEDLKKEKALLKILAYEIDLSLKNQIERTKKVISCFSNDSNQSQKNIENDDVPEKYQFESNHEITLPVLARKRIEHEPLIGSELKKELVSRSFDHSHECEIIRYQFDPERYPLSEKMEWMKPYLTAKSLKRKIQEALGELSLSSQKITLGNLFIPNSNLKDWYKPVSWEKTLTDDQEQKAHEILLRLYGETFLIQNKKQISEIYPQIESEKFFPILWNKKSIAENSDLLENLDNDQKSKLVATRLKLIDWMTKRRSTHLRNYRSILFKNPIIGFLKDESLDRRSIIQAANEILERGLKEYKKLQKMKKNIDLSRFVISSRALPLLHYRMIVENILFEIPDLCSTAYHLNNQLEELDSESMLETGVLIAVSLLAPPSLFIPVSAYYTAELIYDSQDTNNALYSVTTREDHDANRVMKDDEVKAWEAIENAASMSALGIMINIGASKIKLAP